MGFSFMHILLVLVVVLILFGAGKLPRVMGDLGKGIRSFKKGLAEGEDEATNNKITDANNKFAEAKEIKDVSEKN
jgi:sec-independent protein translocase protein TatA